LCDFGKEVHAFLDISSFVKGWFPSCRVVAGMSEHMKFTFLHAVKVLTIIPFND
jgi:hypothetical protein